ncbi:TPA: hypothetical protein JA993_16060 [Legionella pneumophila]|nr:hypothetical protein [Legionella pneumophila]
MQIRSVLEKNNGADMKLGNITPTDACQYKQHLIDSGLRPPTINRRVLSLKYFLEWGGILRFVPQAHTFIIFRSEICQ